MIRANHPYTLRELEQMRSSPELAGLRMKGHYLRHHLDGTVAFVPDANVNRPRGHYVCEVDWGLEPIRKRTPLERKESLVKRWWEECRAAGRVPGLSDAKVSELIGDDWRTGSSKMTIEVVERLAAAMLQDAENRKKAKDFKTLTGPIDD